MSNNDSNKKQVNGVSKSKNKFYKNNSVNKYTKQYNMKKDNNQYTNLYNQYCNQYQDQNLYNNYQQYQQPNLYNLYNNYQQNQDPNLYNQYNNYQHYQQYQDPNLYNQYNNYQQNQDPNLYNQNVDNNQIPDNNQINLLRTSELEKSMLEEENKQLLREKTILEETIRESRMNKPKVIKILKRPYRDVRDESPTRTSKLPNEMKQENNDLSKPKTKVINIDFDFSKLNGYGSSSDSSGSNIFGNQFGSNNEHKQLEDIFSVLLGLPSLSKEKEEEKKSSNKLKVRNYDINSEYIEIDKNVKTLDDLIELVKLYDVTKPELMDKYTVDLKKLNDMKDSLNELKNMIGMNNVKNSIVRQILYFLQGIEEQQDMLHMVITGSPGIGKTSLGVILAKLYYSMGLLEKQPSINPVSGKKEDFVFKIYKRSDLIGQYLGHTAIKTQKAIDECTGGIMFLDEAYSLGHDEKSDIYTKECLDTINQNLSENKKNFILIIAGYPEQLDKCFFSHNEGLKRRFAFRYDIDKYTYKELAKMLILKINQNLWKLDETIELDMLTKIIETNNEMFTNYGGDIESWMLHIKIEHGVRIFGKHPKLRKIINIDDINNGLKQYKIAKENKQQKEKQEKDKQYINAMYN
jgi:hypothetical protein